MEKDGLKCQRPIDLYTAVFFVVHAQQGVHCLSSDSNSCNSETMAMGEAVSAFAIAKPSRQEDGNHLLAGSFSAAMTAMTELAVVPLD